MPTNDAQIRLCIIGNPESIHVRRWASHFAGRGFDVHIVSFYPPREPPADGVQVAALRPRRVVTATAARARATVSRWPGAIRLTTAFRALRNGLVKTVAALRPDVVHAHYVSDYGLLAALTGRHPLVVSAWGSDLLVDPNQSVVTRNVVRWVLSRADLITYDAGQVAQAARHLGADPARMLEVILGVDSGFLDLVAPAAPPEERTPVIVSLRSLERDLYNVGAIVRAMPEVLRRVPATRLIVGNDGSLRPDLERLAQDLHVEHAVEFVGYLRTQSDLAQVLGKASVYVSVPSSDGTSVTLLEAMAAGAYPVVSDLPSNREWVADHGGAVVPATDSAALANAIVRGLIDPGLRAEAAERNRPVIAARGRWDENMARMEDAYRRLVVP